jgi:UDP-N-acetylglucosamine--N-acetylmuramyl-(pentapeptide) pyrophosphoryl-undecaprenol N-acetylglucosamine transferase
VLYVPDIEPGLALKTLARFATRICLTAEESRAYFKNQKKLVVTGYPARPELAAWDKSAARARLGLPQTRPVLLVTGGSKGARSINRALIAALPELLKAVDVLHLSGASDWDEVQSSRAALAPGLAGHYHAYPYLHAEMGAALASADLVVSRAGASTLGEYPLYGLPAVLVPYPYAWRYQKVNAGYLAQRGAAVMLEDARLGAELLPSVQALLADKARLDAMRAAMRALAHPDAAAKIAAQVAAAAGRKAD